MKKFLSIIVLAFVAACSSITAQNLATPTLPPAPSTPTTAPQSTTPPSQPTSASTARAPSTLAVREHIVLRDLPGVGRNPYAMAMLDGKIYAVANGTDNVAVIQNERVVKFIPVGKRPVAIAIDTVQKRIYVANASDKTISLIVNDQVTLTTSLGEEPASLLFIDNRLLAGSASKGNLLVLDPATLQTQSSITIPNTFSIINLAGDAVHHRIYAAMFDKIAIIDSANLKLTKTLDLKGNYFTILANPSNDSLLAAIYDATVNAQFLVALDPVSGAERGRVKIGGDPRGAILTNDGTRVYIANSFSNTVSIIDARNLTPIAEVAVALRPYALALDESARRLYVANSDSDNVSIIDTQTNAVAATIPIGMNMPVLVVNENLNRVYIASASTDSVFVIEGARVIKEIGTGRNPVDLSRDAKNNRLIVADSADNTLTMIDETNFAARITPPITKFLTTAQIDSMHERIFAGDTILDANTLAPIGKLTLRGLTIGSNIAPYLIRINPNNNRIYALANNGIPGSNSRTVTYSIDGNTLEQRGTLAYAGNSDIIVIDPETNRVFIAGTHPLAQTSELNVFDANDAKLYTLPLAARTAGMAYNPQTHHLFLSQMSGYPRNFGATPTPADDIILVIDTNSFGEVAHLNVKSPGKMARLGNTIYVANRADGSITLIEDATLPTPPSPTPTRTPSPFPTLPPLPTVTRIATAPTCTIPMPPLFAQRWNAGVQTRLGCPTEISRLTNFAFQSFEHGTLFWREDEKKIYALIDDKTWQSADDTWISTQPADSCPSVSVGVNRIKPIRGFGKVWCADANLRAQIGAATASEQAFQGLAQRFARGWMIDAPGNALYILLDGGRWE